jgi:ankyrin repeat protein
MKLYFKYLVYLSVFIGFSSTNAGSYDDFFKAIHFDQVQEVQKLLRRGIDPNSPNEKGVPALLVALQSGSPKSAVLLAQEPQTRVEVSNPNNESALMMAALHNQIEVATVLIERGAEVNRKGWTPLHYAATRGHIAMMRLLLENNAYIDAESPNGTTPLMMAAYYAPPLAVKLLLEEGADPTLRNQAKATALDMALANDRKQSAYYLRAFIEAWEIKEAGE